MADTQARPAPQAGTKRMTMRQMAFRTLKILTPTIAKAVAAVTAPLEKRIEALERGLEARSWQGVYDSTKEYVQHNLVTEGGSVWVATRDSKGAPPGHSDAWKLCVKRGRDGRDAR